MFYTSLKLRDPEGLVTPRGPSFSRARTVRSEIDGTEILFKAPKHQAFRGSRERHEPERHTSVEALNFRSHFDENHAGKGQKDNWRQANLFTNSWSFNGPWFTGKVASLHMSLNLIKIVNYPNAFSLFHPRSFENIIADHLSYMYARFINDFCGGIQEINAPVNWRPIIDLPVNSVELDVITQEFLPYDFRKHVYFPLTDCIFASLIFNPRRPYGSMTKSELDKLVDEQPILELIDNIINSIHLTLSPEAKAQQKMALEGMKDTSLTQNYPILKWDDLDDHARQKILAQKGKTISQIELQN